MDKKYLGVIIAILGTVILMIGVIAPIAITDVINNIEKECMQNRVRDKWSSVLSFEVHNINRTNSEGCNYIDSMLMINASLAEHDNHTDYYLRFVKNDYPMGDFLMIEFLPTRSIRLNSTCLRCGNEIYHNPYFGDWTDIYYITLEEYVRYSDETIYWYGTFTIIHTYLGTLSVINGFNW